MISAGTSMTEEWQVYLYGDLSRPCVWRAPWLPRASNPWLPATILPQHFHEPPFGAALSFYSTSMPKRSRNPWALSSSATIHFRRSEEHTSELQSLMRISYAVFCLKKKKKKNKKTNQ